MVQWTPREDRPSGHPRPKDPSPLVIGAAAVAVALMVGAGLLLIWSLSADDVKSLAPGPGLKVGPKDERTTQTGTPVPMVRDAMGVEAVGR